MPNATQDGFQALQEVLEAFSSTLETEKKALVAFDYATIDASAQRKLDLQSRLEFQLQANRESIESLERTEIESLKASLAQCRSQAKHNDALILAYQSHIKRLQEQLSGGSKTGYGPKRRFMAAPSCSQAVLTDSIG